MKLTKVCIALAFAAAFTACQNNASEDDLLKLEKEIAGATSNQNASDSEIEALRAQITALVTSGNASQAEIDAAEQRLEELAAEADASQAEIEAAEATIEDLAAQNGASQAEIDALMAQIDALLSAQQEFPNFSNANALVRTLPGFENIQISTLISSTDILAPTNPIVGRNNFQLAGSADGAGFLKDGDGFMYVVNCEDSYAVARIKLDANLKPISGDYLLNSEVADVSRQCSATMWEKEIHGGDQDLFLSASEAFHFDVKGIDPRVEVPTPTADFGLDALGEFGWENATPLPKDAYPGKTVIIGGDDDSGDFTAFGQVSMYLSENGDADFENGKIYVLRTKQFTNNSGATINAVADTAYNEEDFDLQTAYEVEFVEIVDGKDKTFLEMGQACLDVFATQFMRVEDVDYQKGSAENGRNVFFAVTGRGGGRGTFNDFGSAYKLELDPSNPLEGVMTKIINGNEGGNLPELMSPDNITVTENYVYLQEDPNSGAVGEKIHTAYIYQTDLNGNNTVPVFEFIIDSSLALDPSDVEVRDAEYGALIDISDKIGKPDTFLLALQPHYWENPNFQNLDGHDRSMDQVCDPRSSRFCSREDDQASQIVILSGLPR